MDEPFASVDAQTRSDLEDLLLDIWKRFGVTILFVTHDIDEAVYMAQRVLVLHAPAHVTDEVAVELPYPREQSETKRLPSSRSSGRACSRRSGSRGPPRRAG